VLKRGKRMKMRKPGSANQMRRYGTRRSGKRRM
jgi:hypothetical protein